VGLSKTDQVSSAFSGSNKKLFLNEKVFIKEKFNWLINAEIKDARLSIEKDTLVWNAGTWYSGVWMYGVWRNGDWKSTIQKMSVLRQML
jgi:hypothetical protein